MNPLYTDKDLIADPALEGEWLVKEMGEQLLLTPKPQDSSVPASVSDDGASLDSSKPLLDEVWIFAHDENHYPHYQLTITTASANRTVESKTNYMIFDTCLLKMGGSRFMDVKLVETDIFENRLSYGRDGIPDRSFELLCGGLVFAFGHSYLQVFQTEPVLEVGWLNARWVDDVLAKHPRAIKHVRFDDEVSAKPVLLTASTKELQRFVRRYAKTKEAWLIHIPEIHRRTNGPPIAPSGMTTKTNDTRRTFLPKP